MAILLNIFLTLTESICFVYYFEQCHKKQNKSYVRFFTLIILLMLDGVLPSLIFSASVAMISSFVGMFLIFFVIYSKYIVDFLLSIGIVYAVILGSNTFTDLFIIKFLKLNTFALAYTTKTLSIMIPIVSVEFIALSIFLYNIKFFVVLHNSIMKSQKALMIISFIFMFILLFIVGILFDHNTNIYTRVGLVGAYVIVFIYSFYSFIKDYINVIEKINILEDSQKITQQFQTIQTNYATQFSKLLGMVQLKQFDKIESELKDFIQENSSNSIKITNNLHPILVSSLQKFYDDKIEVIIDNQINLKDLKIELFDLLGVLTSVSEYISFALNNKSNGETDKNRYKIIFKIRDYYDEIEFLYKIYYNDKKIKSFNNASEFNRLKENIKKYQGRIKINCNSIIKLYLPKK